MSGIVNDNAKGVCCFNVISVSEFGRVLLCLLSFGNGEPG